MKRFHLLVCACLLLCLFAATNPLYGQATGRISGTISDATGAVIPGAAVTITNLETGRTWTRTTDENGYYAQTQLPVGPYKVEGQASGFQKATKTGFDLDADGRLTADLKLQLATVTATVQVTEVLGEMVNTVSGELARTVDSEQVQDLALNGRNYLELVALIPGVALLDEDQMTRTTSLSVSSQSVNGGRTDTGNLQVDGGMNLDSGSNGSQINNVGVDFVRQVVVKTSGFSADTGRASGASVNVVTKSGGSEYHGGLLETIRNNYLDAANYFTPRDAQGKPQKPSLRFNDYGWNLGGPIKFGPFKNRKLFFFGGQEYKTIRQYLGSSGSQSPQRRTLPTRANRQGLFADRTTAIYYPTSMYPTRTAVPNKDLSSLMTADGKAIMKVYDAMEKMAYSYVDTPTSNNAIFLVYNPFNWRQDMARVDFQASDRHSFYFRWIHDNYNLTDPYGTFNSSDIPTTPTLRNRPGYGPQLSHVWTVGPRVINEAKISSSWNKQRTPLVGDAWKRSTYGFQFPLLYGGNGKYGASGIPNVSISSFTGFNGAAYVYLLSPTTDISISDNLTYSRRAHTIKTGILVIRNRKDQNGRALYNGSVAFNTSGNTNTSNYALADAVLGNFQTYTEAAYDPVGFFRFNQQEAYVQDSWKVARSLSIEIGLRFSHYIPTYAQANNLSNFVVANWDPKQAVKITQNPAALIVPNSGNPWNGLVRVGEIPKDQVGRVPAALNRTVNAVPVQGPRGLFYSMNFYMPRFSFAWVPRSNGKATIRAGFGTFHTRDQGNMFFSQSLLPPFSGSASYESGSLGNVSGGTAAALAPLGGISAIDPKLKNGAVYNYNFGVQRELKGGLFLDVSYAGNVGHHLSRKPDINYPDFAVLAENYKITSSSRPGTNAIRPYSGYSSIRMFLSDANSNYNALQTYLTRRKGNAVFTVSYTWSHSLTDAPSYDYQADSGLEYEDRHRNYGPSTSDRRHIFVTTYTYRVPLLRNRHGILGTAFGRWEISGVFRKQSGAPLTPTGSATGVTRRSDYIGGDWQLSADQRGPNKWFNTAAFQTAPATRLGNAGVGIITGPGLITTDISLRKEFIVRRAAKSDSNWRLKFQADAFNLPNHPNFRNPSVTTSNSDVGTVTSCGPARSLQFGLKFNF